MSENRTIAIGCATAGCALSIYLSLVALVVGAIVVVVKFVWTGSL